MLPFITAAALIFALVNIAHAHYVWLERDGEEPVRAYFGEWIDDIREKTGGLLDRFKAPRVFVGASSDPASRRCRSRSELVCAGLNR